MNDSDSNLWKALPKPQEAQKLEGMEQNLREALVHQNQAAAASAREILQTEVTNLNNSNAAKNDSGYLYRVGGQVVLNDLLRMHTSDHHRHYPAITIDKEGRLEILANKTIIADESVAKTSAPRDKELSANRLPELTRKRLINP